MSDEQPVQLCISMEPELRRRLRCIAKMNGLGISEFCATILDQETAWIGKKLERIGEQVRQRLGMKS